MRLLHTADWHLGHALRDWERTWEHDQFLAWLLDTLEAERVDALLICGDVFDTTNPSAVAQLQWYRFLASARRRMPKLQIIVIGGNHDAAGRLEAPNPILQALAIEIVGALPRSAEAGRVRLVVPLRREAQVEAWAAVVPFLRPADLPPVQEEVTDPLIEGVRRVYSTVLDEIDAQRETHQAVVALGHAYFVGGTLSELSERKILGGNQHALPTDFLRERVTYGAFGHLHLAQKIGTHEHLRYSGSPLPLSVAEAGYPHQVLRVDLDRGGLADVQSLPVPRAVHILRVPVTGALPLPEVEEALRRLDAPRSAPQPTWPFLDVAVEVTRPEPALIRRIEEALRDKGVRLVRVTRQGSAAPRSLGDALGATSLRDLTPEQVFTELHRRTCQKPPEPDLLAAFAELVEQAQRGH
ncbi:MAG: exonuclease SbcCD subunit D C-terminal domain-containing protein [Myxococcales bacterium]|nr:exonuclease SbcCD subunit D C-terminal domain-containing protein [Polyangiaceae bacterium]MDW8250764.1 exonuclease SbcCD subunit D C-terminal domain-containing protein [Myxococcales bacterium]